MPPFLTPIPSCTTLFAAEPVLASFAHMTVIMHSSLQRSLAFILANKLQSSTLLGTQLTRLFVEAYEVRPCCLLPGYYVGAVCLQGRSCTTWGGHGAGWILGTSQWRGLCKHAMLCKHAVSAAQGIHLPILCLICLATGMIANLPRPPTHPPTHRQDDPSLIEAAVADLQAVVERDPACDTYVKPLLFFKGFQVRGMQACRGL